MRGREKIKREDTLSDFTRDKKVITLSFMAIVIGAMSAFLAFTLVWLINVITNLCLLPAILVTLSVSTNASPWIYRYSYSDHRRHSNWPDGPIWV